MSINTRVSQLVADYQHVNQEVDRLSAKYQSRCQSTIIRGVTQVLIKGWSGVLIDTQPLMYVWSMKFASVLFKPWYFDLVLY